MGIGAWILLFVQIVWAIILGNPGGTVIIGFNRNNEMIFEFWLVLSILLFLGFFAFYLYKKQYKGKIL